MALLVGSEISVDSGHYFALDIPLMAPRFNGPAQVVMRDVNRAGGFGIIAHPYSPGYSSWTDWRLTGFSGMEIVNGASMFKRAGIRTLLAGLFFYPLNPDYCFLKFLKVPADNLQKWDALCSENRVCGTYGADVHSNISPGDLFRLRIPSYESVFRAASINLWVRNSSAEWRSDFQAVKQAVFRAIKAGNSYIAFDSMGRDSGFIYYAAQHEKIYLPGEWLSFADTGTTLTVSLQGPAGMRIRLLRNGETVLQAEGDTFTYRPEKRGAYRVEIYLPPGISPTREDMPWIISNPIYIGRHYAPAVEEEKDELFEIPPYRVIENFEAGESVFRPASEDRSKVVFRIESQIKSRNGTGEANQIGRYSFHIGERDPEEHYTWCTFSCRKSPAFGPFEGISFRAKSDQFLRLAVRIKEITPRTEAALSWDYPVLIDSRWRRYHVPFSRMVRYAAEKNGWERAGTRTFSREKVITFLLDNHLNHGGTKGILLIDDIALYP